MNSLNSQIDIYCIGECFDQIVAQVYDEVEETFIGEDLDFREVIYAMQDL